MITIRSVDRKGEFLLGESLIGSLDLPQGLPGPAEPRAPSTPPGVAFWVSEPPPVLIADPHRITNHSVPTHTTRRVSEFTNGP